MGVTDSAGEMFDKAKEKLSGKTDEASAGVDKAAEAADEKTGKKHSDKIDKGADAAKGGIDKLGGNR
jgi:hypothetical protein